MFIETVRNHFKVLNEVLSFPSGEMVNNSRELYVLPLSEANYKLATLSLKAVQVLVTAWQVCLPEDVTLLLNQAWARHVGEDPDFRHEEDVPSCGWKKGDFLNEESKRHQLWQEAKKELLETVLSVQTHLDLRLCATAANKVAQTLGRARGVSVRFAEENILDCADDDSSVPGGFTQFARIVAS